MGYTTSDAPRPSEVQACIQCGLCLPFCPTYRLTGNEKYSPRGRLSAMNAVLEGVTGVDEAFEDALSTCLGCRACEAVCPGLVPYGRAFEGARAEITAQRPTLARRVRKPLLGRALGWRGLLSAATVAIAAVQRLGATTVFPPALRRSFAGIRDQRVRRTSWVGRDVEALGLQRGVVGLLAGCVMDPWFAPVHDATVGILRRAGYRVRVHPSQTCCGALAAHDGHADDARRLAGRNVDAFRDVDLVVSDAAGCSAHLKEYGHWAGASGADLAGRTRDITELVASLIEEGTLPTLDGDHSDVAVQDPCHLRHAQRIVDAPRTIIAAAGYRPVDIDPDGICCGAAGIYSVLYPQASAELGARKADQIRGAGTTIVASANPGCEMQLRGHLGRGYEIVHPVELYWRALTASARYSARRR